MFLSLATPLTVNDFFTYTDQGRLLEHRHKINTRPEELIARNDYDALGQLMNKRVGGLATGQGLQKVDFTYNIRGWLKGINDLTNLTQGNTDPSNPKDLFAFKLNYNTVDYSVQGAVAPLYNGNISETFWRTGSDNTVRKYGYVYDDLNRLTEAIYQKPNSVNPEAGVTNAYNEEMSYDKNGNILTLVRRGYRDDHAGNNYIIDNLNYLYDKDTNVLRRVDDVSNSLDGFLDGNKNKQQWPTHEDYDYLYDAHGNMTADLNKDIQAITYNHLNLPTKIDFKVSAGEKFISYLYNAVGQKVRKLVLNQSPDGAPQNVVTDYLDGYQYVDASLQFFPTAEGYVRVSGGTIFNYVYHYTDHLGNIRLSYTKEGTTVSLLEENHYYPFGMKHSYNSDIRDWGVSPETGEIYAVLEEVRRGAYQYKYNGKEYQDELSLNWYDYGARNYDPAIGRWMNIDPLAEKYKRWTPYNYAMDNPVKFIDPDGKRIKIGKNNYSYVETEIMML
ncbi:RHS repeat domain-containing protein [Flavobacterium soli]|uniref:RHS repeat domain-containing protein n=1 Tax=Flavobacterium soli TaxID=344881 RepID=UPI00047E0349|nr:RHS repeat-associated core domain-containing protein [Flavobacterium soli]